MTNNSLGYTYRLREAAAEAELGIRLYIGIK